MSICLPHTIAVCGMYALTGYPVTRLDVGLSTYRRFAAGGIRRKTSSYAIYVAYVWYVLIYSPCIMAMARSRMVS